MSGTYSYHWPIEGFVYKHRGQWETGLGTCAPQTHFPGPQIVRAAIFVPTPDSWWILQTEEKLRTAAMLTYRPITTAACPLSRDSSAPELELSPNGLLTAIPTQDNYVAASSGNGRRFALGRCWVRISIIVVFHSPYRQISEFISKSISRCLCSRYCAVK